MTAVPISDVADRAEFEAVIRGLREREAVVPVVLDGGLRAWVITRYAEGRAALRDQRLVKNPHEVNAFKGVRHAEDSYVVEGRHMLNSDGADHVRLRGVVASQLLPASAVAALRPAVAEIAGRLLDDMGTTSSADLMAAYARPLPELVMGRVLGIPEESILALARLSRRLATREDSASAGMRAAYNDAVDLVRAEMTGTPPPGTVLATLLDAVAERRITRRELVSTVLMLLAAGTSSTTIAIGHGAATLAGTASTLRALLESEETSADLVEELIRHHPPFPFSPWRFAREAIEIDGITIPAGSVVFILLAAVNRDPAVIERPEQLVPGRRLPTGHLTFGYGPHFCVGANLARMEIATALRTLFDRFPNLTLAIPYSDVAWTGLLFDRTITALPVLPQSA
ncbi:cytochrome P450 [Amycolatopsis sp. EV170708-02-1]|uniref:cytochrome P450 n=1 Tax=Amycolatopsis sp. EV170708-02-1 TaxID=2919322 RepID=UPI001F0B7637|nr:cytochrome P450 [Amycolatopsis sp. EV170708-02-1]UMP06992.1 cytochrome P450 [Amycolatopsis sp. EV170708-02-1]